MALTRRSVDLRSPPEEFDALVDWFDQVCTNLVLLEEYPTVDLGAGVHRIDRAIRDHVGAFRYADPAEDHPRDRRLRIIAEDHVRFLVSLEQLDWCLRVVEKEDHGGHRQALGQYGQVLAEALRRHRREERFCAAEKP